MVNFPLLKILHSFISALLYGAFFSLIANFIYLLFDSARIFLFAIKRDNDAQRRIIHTSSDTGYSQQRHIVIVVAEIIIFGIGFSVVSFITLEGNLRLYSLLSSILGWYFTETLILVKTRTSILNIIEKIALKFQKLSEKLRFRYKNRHFFKKIQKNASTNDRSPP